MKRRLIVLMAAAVPVAAALLIPMAADATGKTPAAAGCAAVPVSAPAGTTVEKVTAAAHAGGTITFPPPPESIQNYAPISGVPAWCDITVTVTHPGANDHVAIKVSLPQDRKLWNGRFQATGGSAYLAGEPLHPLVVGVKAGYAAASTDAGVGADPVDVSGWALTSDGNLNTPLLQNFASRSLHDMAVVGKSVTAGFYHKAAGYSYWNGCSTGGRQGYEEAQDYPADFDGILAKAPALDWDRFAIGTLWSQAVYNELGVAPTQCELNAFTGAAVKACDTKDGVRDGVIDNPVDCKWDARKLVGTKIVCDGRTITVNKATADAVNKIWAGPKGYVGPNKGANLDSLATPGTPFFVASIWAKYFVTRNPSYDASKLDYKTFYQLLASSEKQFKNVIGTGDPDLSKFARAGGKLLSWHGQSDQLVPTRGTIEYRQRVNRLFGGNKNVDNFYRLFLLPGVDHCGAGTGNGPQVDDADALAALTRWVEKGQAPATLPATLTDSTGQVVRTSDICRYPLVSRYQGAAGHRCV
ncbi:tannase/feruloyl esterase family alpha/beta hydrolase [Actinoplanes sp. NPDC049596]|uniref:tannase/feruloyl esterase family alpha/beta hydrolase n=1 Tax=unclassified Actinoplanes TaxID=2626549 RepID=UPI00343B45BC